MIAPSGESPGGRTRWHFSVRASHAVRFTFFDEYTAVGIVALEWRRPVAGMTPLPLSLIADLEPINGELA
jgi:hypothetical protein